MTDYSDGQIHGWNGGECPVHPKSVVHVRNRFCHDNYVGEHEDEARWFSPEVWAGTAANSIVSFRVVKAYREPRVFWVNEYPTFFGGLHDTEEDADGCAGGDRIACHRIELQLTYERMEE